MSCHSFSLRLRERSRIRPYIHSRTRHQGVCCWCGWGCWCGWWFIHTWLCLRVSRSSFLSLSESNSLQCCNRWIQAQRTDTHRTTPQSRNNRPMRCSLKHKQVGEMRKWVWWCVTFTPIGANKVWVILGKESLCVRHGGYPASDCLGEFDEAWACLLKCWRNWSCKRRGIP